jgi:hypothetical protein
MVIRKQKKSDIMSTAQVRKQKDDKTTTELKELALELLKRSPSAGL